MRFLALVDRIGDGKIAASAGERHDTAVDLLERSIRRGNCTQTLQSFCEHFNVATRKAAIEASAAVVFIGCSNTCWL